MWTQGNDFLFLFLNFEKCFGEFKSKNNCQHLTNQRWNMRNKVWSNTTLLFEWRFRFRQLSPSLLPKLPIEKQRGKGRARGRSAEKKGEMPYFFPTDPILCFELLILLLTSPKSLSVLTSKRFALQRTPDKNAAPLALSLTLMFAPFHNQPLLLTFRNRRWFFHLPWFQALYHKRSR